MGDVDSQDVAMETPAEDVFIAPSIREQAILAGKSYTYHSPVPENLTRDMSVGCVLGIDEAGRGPVLGPMVYGLVYLPMGKHHPLLAQTYRFADSKVLTPTTRSSLMHSLCTANTDLYQNCGWATRVMSAKDISAGMFQPTGTYNLNAQAIDATIDLIKDVFARGINIGEIYIDTIGSPAVYQKKLERIFPTTRITVAKKADSLYPCVSAASVCAKVTRDAALQVCYKNYASDHACREQPAVSATGWGSGYPSDGRCTTWLKENMNPIFGWGSECRFSWGTVKELLEAKGSGIKVDWQQEDDESSVQLLNYFKAAPDGELVKGSEKIAMWFGESVAEELFR